MRIGHQIYTYLSEYSVDGSCELSKPIEFKPNWPGKMETSYIIEAYINWDQDQVYIRVTRNGIPSDYSINAFVKLMGGPAPQNYKPLYELRDVLKKWSNNVRKRVIDSQTITYYKSSTPFNK